MIYTVFPKKEGEMPQDFPTYSDAQNLEEATIRLNQPQESAYR